MLFKRKKTKSPNQKPSWTKGSMQHRPELADLMTVGENKPIGHLSQEFLNKISGFDKEDLLNTIKERNLSWIEIAAKNCHITDGALFVYHEAALQKVLDENKQLLEDESWPTDAMDFITHHANHIAEPGTDLFNLVADTYGDTDNPGRKSI